MIHNLYASLLMFIWEQRRAEGLYSSSKHTSWHHHFNPISHTTQLFKILLLTYSTALLSFTTYDHSSLLPGFCLNVIIFNSRKSFSTPFSHLKFYLPTFFFYFLAYSLCFYFTNLFLAIFVWSTVITHPSRSTFSFYYRRLLQRLLSWQPTHLP
jgi:hypothetical protein